jgi:hypothetical protein
LGVAFAAPGKPVVLFRNVFDDGVRDHAVIAFADVGTPGPVHRVAVDDWAINACPHHGPSLSVAPDGAYHVTWFTNGRARKGLFYAQSTDGGQTFSAPIPIGTPSRGPSRPYVLATSDAVWLTWKEFDGEQTTVLRMLSRDGGRSWSQPKAIAEAAGASDHPLLVANADRVFVSWQSQAEGYRLLPLEDAR